MAIKKITIAIDENIVNEIDEKAKQAKRSRSNYLECAIEEHLKSEDNSKLLRDRITELETEIKILKAVPTVVPQTIITQPIETKTETKVEAKGFVTKIPDGIPDNF